MTHRTARRIAGRAAGALAFALTAAGCDIGALDETIRVSTDRLTYDFRATSLAAGQATTLASNGALTIDGVIPGGFTAREVAEAYIESVRIEQVAPSGAVYTLGHLQNVTFSVNGQNVATNASLSGTTATLASNGANAGGVFTSNNVRGGLTFTPTRALPEEYALRVSFVARVVVRGL